MNASNTYPHESPAMTPPQNDSLPNKELRSVTEETLFRMHADHSQPQPTETYMAAMVASWTAHLSKAQIPWQDVPGLYDNAIRSRAADSARRGFMPVIEDLLHEWEVLSQRAHQSQQADEWKRRDAERLNALPQGQDGPGRQAWIALGKRGAPVVCDCEPARSAVLSPDSLTWQCATLGCSFSWTVSDTVNAPAKGKRGPLFDEVRATATDAEKAAKAIRKTAGGNHSPFLLAFAADCDIVLDACTPQQYVEFRKFAHWFKDLYPGCKITPSLLQEEYPRFQRETASKAQYI